MTRVLAIDTAGRGFAVALRDGDQTSVQVSDAAREHSRLLLATIDELLDEDRTLDLVVVVTGPGAYSGVRAGIAVAKGLAMATGAPLAGVSTMAAIARAAGPGDWNLVHPVGRSAWALQTARDGALLDTLSAIDTSSIESLPNLAGEGASAAGGREITQGERCAAALELGAAMFAAGDIPPVEAVYLREPGITRPREGRAVPS